jgi:DNA-binding transcriptional LysR family regulator
MMLFAVVVREGGFTRAARELGITKQSVSERIAKLEQRLGVRLLERTTRRFRVSEEGAAYYERCAAIAAQIEEANHEVLARRSEPVGLLRVTAPTLFGRRFLAPVIADTLARYPKMRLQVTLANSAVDLLEEGIDVAIRVGELEDSSLSAKKLGDGYIYVVASPRFLAKHKAPTLDTLGQLPAVVMRPGESWRIGGRQIKVEPRLVVNDLELVCEAAIAGVGVAFLPSLVCREAVLDGRLVRLLDHEPAASRPVYAVLPSRRYVPATVRVFLEALRMLVEPMEPITAKPARRSGLPSRSASPSQQHRS